MSDFTTILCREQISSTRW